MNENRQRKKKEGTIVSASSWRIQETRQFLFKVFESFGINSLRDETSEKRGLNSYNLENTFSNF